jgi:hypothetical protein
MQHVSLVQCLVMAYHETHPDGVSRDFVRKHRVRPQDRVIEDTQSLMLTKHASRPTRACDMVGDGRINTLH